MIEFILFGLSTVFGITAYAVYFLDTRRTSIQPNRWSWLIWGLTTIVEVATFHAVSGDLVTSAVFYVSAIACGVITLLVWRKAKWEWPSCTEFAVVLLSIGAVVIWLVFHQAWWAHLIALVAVPISFIPTYSHAWKDWSKENSPSWVLWTIGDVLALMYVINRMQSLEELPYAAIEAVSHAAMWVIVSWRARNIHDNRIRKTERSLWHLILSLTVFVTGVFFAIYCLGTFMKSVHVVYIAGTVGSLFIIGIGVHSVKRSLKKILHS